VILASSLFIFFAAKGILLIFKDRIIALGESLVRRYIYGKPFHRYDLEMYMEKTRSFYESIVSSFSLKDLFVLFSVVLCAFLIAIMISFMRGYKIKSVCRPVFLTIILLDLLVFSAYGTGFRGNIYNFDFVEPDHRKIFNHIKHDKGLFRILPYDLTSPELPNWTDPSLNAVYAIDNIALYTPLVNEYYRKELRDLEVADNALGLKRPEEGVIEKNLDIIRALNVKYVISPEKIKNSFLDLVVVEDGIFLYELRSILPRAFVSRDLSLGGVDTAIPVKIVYYSSGKALFEVNMPYDGFLVFSENRYLGWKVSVNEKVSKIEPFSVIQAVSLGKGTHRVEFNYDPWASVKYKN
jgi:hypothetical protein